jgi:hypothetical protein
MPAQHLRAAATLLEMASFLKAEHIPLAFGGNIFNQIPALPARIPGHFLGETLSGAVQKIEHLLTTRPPLPPAIKTPAACGRALEHYQTRQALIEVDLCFGPVAKELPPVQLITANRELARNIVAALALGDIHFADAAMTCPPCGSVVI